VHLICSVKAEIRCLTSVYVYCRENTPVLKQIQLETWIRNNEPIVTNVYVKPSDIFPQLTKDVSDICDHDSIPVTYLNFQEQYFNLTHSSSFLIFDYFLHQIIFHLTSDFALENQRIFRSCLTNYRDNDERLREIKSFQQDYSCQTSIDWYLNTKFLSRLLHKSIRTENLSVLFDFSFIFNDIQHLIKEYSSALPDPQQIRIFYRAQNLNTDDLHRLRSNINGILSINRFLDLYKTADEATNIVSLTSNTLETILYHLTLSHSFIPISNNRYLLAIGSLFRIRHIALEIDGIWHVHLTMIDKHEIKNQIDPLLKDIDLIPHEYLTIGLIWDKLKQTAKAEKFYRLIMEHLPKMSEETAYVYNCIGEIFRLKCQYQIALNCHRQALAIFEEGDSQDDIDRTNAQIGFVYRDMGDIFNAIQSLKLAVRLGEDIYNCLAEIYRNIEQFDVAESFYKQTKYDNDLGLCYLYQRIFPKALTRFKKGNQPLSYINLAFYHQLQREYSTALIYFEKALETVRNCPLDTAMIHSYLGHLHCDCRQWLLSLKHYQQALKLYKIHLSTYNHPTIAMIYDGIGTLYLNKGEYRAAQQQFQRCLDLQLRVLSWQHPDIAGTYNNLGGVFNEMGHYDKALLYHYKALSIATATLPAEHSDIKLYEHNITETKRKLM